MGDAAVLEEESAVPEALATGLIGMDAARRVGWAKAFEALRRVDSLEEEVRQMRDELKYLRRAYSRLLGFIDGIPFKKTSVFREEIAAHLRAESTFRFKGAWMQGQLLALDHKAELRGWSPEQREVERHRLSDTSAPRSKESKQRLRNLYDAAVSRGHRIETPETRTEWERTTATCTCGATSGVTEQQYIITWRREHCAQVVHGISFAEWDKGAR